MLVAPVRTLACILVWSILLGIGCYLFGAHVQSNADQVAIAKDKERERDLKARKDTKGLAAGLRTERAQAQTDTSFQLIRAAYETEQRDNSLAGCVLDPVSLRLWNEANAQSDGPAAGQPDGEVPAAAEGEPRRERGQ